MKIRRAFWLTAVVGTLLDLITKTWAHRVLKGAEPWEVLPGFLHFAYSENPGAAFSILAGQRALFIVISIVAFAALVYFSHEGRRAGGGYHVALGGILAGVLGNLYDRVVFGVVRDFIDVHVGWSVESARWWIERFGTNHWPTFNLADSYIVCGALFIIGWSLVHGDGALEPDGAEDAEA